MKETGSMNDIIKDNLTERFPLTTRLALERTRGSYERTLMAWNKLGTSLITFGFAVYKFFQFEAASLPSNEGILNVSLLGPREFGVILISIGILSLLIGSIEHARDLRGLRKDYPDMPFSGTRLIALLTAILGAMALIAVIYRF
jgi:putative membrane protein